MNTTLEQTTTTKPKLSDIKTIHIYGCRWFQKTYGNTYNAFRFTVNWALPGEFSAQGGMAYGYGSMWEQRAYETLAEMLGCTYHDIIDAIHSGSIKTNNSCQDVSTQRELKRFSL